jgi:23S rRNA (pseudouridine1915-N3)-methyltransferase
MRMQLIAVGKRQPDWVNAGYHEYARRLKGACTLKLTEIPPGRRSRVISENKARDSEGERMLRAIPPAAHVVALTVNGRAWSTRELAERLKGWMTIGAPVCLLVGGPDGLSSRTLQRANERWSVSPLTLPHGLVRPVVAEALYRAWSLIQGHPYHRE